MDIIIGVKKFFHGWGRVLVGWPDIILSNFELQKSVIYKFVCTLWENDTNEYNLWNQEDYPWIRKSSWMMNRSTFVKILSYIEVWNINLYVLFEINLMVSSKLLMDIILGVRKILNSILGHDQRLCLQLVCMWMSHLVTFWDIRCHICFLLLIRLEFVCMSRFVTSDVLFF